MHRSARSTAGPRVTLPVVTCAVVLLTTTGCYEEQPTDSRSLDSCLRVGGVFLPASLALEVGETDSVRVPISPGSLCRVSCRNNNLFTTTCSPGSCWAASRMAAGMGQPPMFRSLFSWIMLGGTSAAPALAGG